MHFYTFIVVLLSSLSIVAALPLPSASNDQSVKPPSEWRFFRKISFWTVSFDGLSDYQVYLILRSE